MDIGFPKKKPIPIDQSCVGYWKFDEASGDIRDWSGNSNTGTAYNLTYSQPGKFGNACNFNGTTSYVNTGSNASLWFDDSKSFTIEVWIKPTALPYTEQIISRNAAPYDFTIMYGYGSGGLSFLRGSSSHYIWYDGGFFTLNDWNHMIVTLNANNNESNGYINGKLIATGTDLTTIGTSGGQPVVIGKAANGWPQYLMVLSMKFAFITEFYQQQKLNNII